MTTMSPCLLPQLPQTTSIIPTTSTKEESMNLRRRPANPLTGSPIPEPISNWSKLSRADEVEIHGHGQAMTSGRIDMLAADGSVLWLLQNEGMGRMLFLHSDDGVRVYRRQRISKS